MAEFALHRLDNTDDAAADGEHPHERLPYSATNPAAIFAHYAVDWIAAVALVLVTWLARSGAHTQRFYEADDPSFLYPYDEDTVSTTMLGFIGVGVPLVTGFAVEVLLVTRLRKWPFLLDAHHFCLGILQAHALGQLTTIVLKGAVGRLRPSAFHRHDDGGHGWNESFPSGHTSLSFTGMAYIALFLAGKTGIFSSRGLLWHRTALRKGDPFRGSFAVGLGVVVAPFALATYVGASRLIDYAHDFSDVNAGAAIGTVTAFFAYHCNYPTVTNPLGALPRPLALLHRADTDWVQSYHQSRISSIPMRMAQLHEMEDNSIPLRERDHRVGDTEMALVLDNDSDDGNGA